VRASARSASLEGADALILLLDDLIQASGAAGIEGSRHRHGAPRPAATCS
jgi:hypothetical protein